MKKLPSLIFAALAAALCTTCSKSLDDQQEQLTGFVKSHRYGSSPDMWLVRRGLVGSERVALIYGFAPDSEFCDEVARMYNTRYPDGARYSCEQAN